MLLMLWTFAAGAMPPVWVEFDRRPSGVAESPYEYDKANLRHDARRVRVTYRYAVLYSGIPDSSYRIRIEIDCARNRARVTRRQVHDGIDRRTRRYPLRLPTPTIATPIAPGSIEEALARRVCAG